MKLVDPQIEGDSDMLYCDKLMKNISTIKNTFGSSKIPGWRYILHEKRKFLAHTTLYSQYLDSWKS